MYIIDDEKKESYIEVFFLDTNTTVLNRIAWALNTLPEYIWIDTDHKTRLSTDIRERVYIIDLWKACQQKDVGIYSLLSKYSDNFKVDDIITLWAYYHISDFNALKLDPNFNEAYPFVKDIYNPSRQLTELQKKKSTFHTAQNVLVQKFRFIKSIAPDPQIDVSNIITDKVVRQLSFDTDKNDLSSVFNDLKTTPTIPLITHNNYYKIYENYIPQASWLSSEDKIMCKYVISNDDVVSISIYLRNNKIIAEMQQIKEADTDEILKSLFTNIVNPEFTDNTIGGYFMTDYMIDNNLFGDIILSGDYFHEFICFNDNVRHAGKYGSRIMYFTLPYSSSKQALVATMTRKIITKENERYNRNTPYVSIKIIRATDNAVIDIFRLFFIRLLNFYKLNESNLAKSYASFGAIDSAVPVRKGPGRKPKEQLPEPYKKISFFKELVPTIFVSQNPEEIYSRRCQKKITLISEDEKTEYENKNMQVLTFPKEQDEHISVPQQYVCLDPTYPYPGLIKFNNVLGVAPCCFKVDQRGKPIFTKYYSNVESEKKQQNVYIKQSDKIIKLNDFGYFPSGRIVNHISELFERINVKVIRQGINYSVNSFLECILYALNIENYSQKNEQEQTILLTTYRNKFKQHIHLGLQEGIPLTHFDKMDTFIDPEYSIRIAEFIFNCNILLFYKTLKYPNGQIIVPQHKNGYCKFVRDDTKPSVFIFVHLGAETDLLTHPHCELIIPLTPEMEVQLKKNKQLENIKSYWVKKDIGYEFCWRIYDTLSTYYYKNKKIKDCPPNLPELFNIESQYIDSSGKVRRLKLKNGPIVDTSPLPPFNVPLLTNLDQPTRLNKSDIIRWMKDLKLNLPTEYTIHNNIYYMQGWYNSIFYLRFYTDQIPLNQISQYKSFFQQSKFARCVLNWTLYQFSKTITENTSLTEEYVRKFVQQFIQSGKNVAYSLTDSFKNCPKNVILDSPELNTIRENIIYQILLLSKRDKTKLLNYKNKTTLDSYYMSEYDFDIHEKEYIVYFTETTPVRLTKMVDFAYPVHTLHTHLPTHTTSTFFYKHPTITRNKIVLSQISKTAEDAFGKAVQWNDNGILESTQIREQIPYYLYCVSKSNTTELYQVHDGFVEDNLSIVAMSNQVFAPILQLDL